MRLALFSFGVCGGAIASLFLLAGDMGDTDVVPAERPAERIGSSAIGISNESSRDEPATDFRAAESRREVLDALLARADTSPSQALDESLALDGALRTAALQRVAKVWARRDPRAALAQAAGLPEALRAGFESAVVREWAFVDPAGFLAYAEAQRSVERLLAGFDVLLATNPDRVFAMAERELISGSFTIDALYRSAVRAMVERDPGNAITQLLPLATGMQRDPLLRVIAQAYAATDVDAALGWASSLSPPSLEAVNGVILGVAGEDLFRAYEMLNQFEGSTPTFSVSVAGNIVDSALAARQSPESLANELVRRRDRDDAMLPVLLLRWAGREPQRVIEWMAAHESSVTPRVAQVLASSLGFADVRLAADFERAIPENVLDHWVTTLAYRYGQFDVAEALQWVARFEGRAGYTEAMTQLLSGAAESEPARAATLIEKSSVPVGSRPIREVVQYLTQFDPEAAMRWAVGIENAETSRMATDIAARVWVGIDASAAERWARAQPRGPARDRILEELARRRAEAATEPR